MDPTRRPRRARAGAWLVAALLLAGCGASSDAPEPAGTPDEPLIPPGSWNPARGGQMASEVERLRAEGLDWKEVQQEIKRLESIGYLSGANAAPDEVGVTIHRRDLAWQGLNFYASGHATQAVLMDMDGKVLHTWECSYERAFPDAPQPAPGEHWRFRDYFRRCRLERDGSVLAIFEGQALIKLSRDSELLWTFDGGAHHDLEVLDDGEIWVLTRSAHLLPRIHASKPVLEDFVSVLGPDGRERRRISILEAFERSAYASLLERMPASGDLLHTNTLEVLDGRLAERLPAFAAGNVLLSCLKIDALAVLDSRTETIVWAATGTWKRQHDPTVLDNGHLLLFDNHGDPSGNGTSRVMEIDPLTLETVWSWGGTPSDWLQTGTCGTSQRLPNGNTLISESENGRALEVTPDGTLAWEFVSPHRPESDQDLIAMLFELVRLPPDFPLDWLD